MNDDGFLRRAVELARQGMDSGLGGPFGAVVVRDGFILAEGQNRVTSALDPTAHAEVVAVRRACAELANYSLKGCTLYSSCEPCPMCLAAVYWSRCDRLVFAASRRDAAEIGFDDEFLYVELSASLSARALPTTQRLREEARTMMLGWAELPGRRLY